MLNTYQMSNAEKIKLLLAEMGPSSGWHLDKEHEQRVVELSKDLGTYQVSDMDEKKNKVIMLHHTGLSASEIMYEVGLALNTVKKTIKEFQEGKRG